MRESRAELYGRTWVQDALAVTKRPPWLNGVPILVDKESKKAHKGTFAFRFVQDFKDDEPMFAGAVAGNYFGFEGDSVSKYASAAARPDSCWDKTEDADIGVDLSSAPGASGSSRGAPPPPPPAQTAAEAYMEARGRQDSRAARWQRGPPGRRQ